MHGFQWLWSVTSLYVCVMLYNQWLHSMTVLWHHSHCLNISEWKLYAVRPVLGEPVEYVLQLWLHRLIIYSTLKSSNVKFNFYLANVNGGEVLMWLSVWSEVQMICISSSLCHCPSSLASLKSRMVYLSGAGLPRLSWKKRPLNGCSSVVNVNGSFCCSVSAFVEWFLGWQHWWVSLWYTHKIEWFMCTCCA